MRNAFAEELTKLASENKKVMLLSGDIGNNLFNNFKLIAPERFYNCGVAEANMTGVAAGLAMMGFRPVTYTITPFAIVRCLEQIRVDVCYHNVPVIIAGTGSGLSYASLGPTHHSCDDIGFMRMLPNMTILCPCDPIEVKSALRAAFQLNSPVYIRLGKTGEPNIHKAPPEFIIGRSITMLEGRDICILSTGNIMPVALEVAENLETYNVSVRVENFHTIKPLDTDSLKNIFSEYKLVATLEEHSLINGLGGAVAEWISDQNKYNVKLLRFGTRDEFMSTIGSQNYARAYYNLTPEYIVSAIKENLCKQ